LILLLIPIIASSDTTENLLNQQFYDGNNFANSWSGTNDHNHGNSIVAGVDGEYIENSISLQNDAGLSKGIINNGFTSTAGADIWFWNRIEQNVEITQTLVDDNGNVTTQTKTISNDGCYYCTHNDSVAIGNNSQEDYEITVRYTFNENSNSPYHHGADLRNPTLVIDYDPVVLSTLQKTEINTAVEKVKGIKIEEYKFEEVKVNIIEEEIKIEEVKFEEEIKLEEKEFIEETIVFKPEEVKFEEEVVEEPKVEEVYEEIVESPMENTNETETIEEEERDTEVAQSSGDTIEAEAEQDNSRSVEITVEEISTKVAEKIESVDEQLKAIQFITAKVMQRNDMISSYSQVNAEIFKQPVIIDTDINSYLNQTYVDIRDIYSNNTYEDRQDWTSR